ncbi:16S rRNA (uracil(1498)-N(3))-methyltransferase [Salinithrix halophila]|uniref:Ribosomal RNA small subunit methyltransferase E n=1 Tax=Salinithrix halophila TaxID=1485204 RepID=A0ABV8JHD8_9BACL
MQRYFVNSNQIDENTGTIRIRDTDVHHIKNVLRLSVGDKLVCCDGDGADYRVEITGLEGEEVHCRIVAKTPSTGEPERLRVTVAPSLPKGDKMDWVLQKGTELGAFSFLPFSSIRTVVKLEGKKVSKKRERWQRIVKEAAEQSCRGRIPQVEPLMDWKGLIGRFADFDQVLFAYEKGGAPLARLLTERGPGSILVVVGPEGGFTDEETEEARSAGADIVHLGPRILRAETAPLALLSCISYTFGEMGGEPL